MNNKIEIIAHVLKEVAETKGRTAKIEVLKANDSLTLRTVLRGNFDDRIVFDLPKGPPPYRALDPEIKGPRPLSKELAVGKFKHIVKGNSVPLDAKRESIFINLLEVLHPDEAELIVKMKDKSIKVTGMTVKLINEAFPGLLPEQTV